MGQRSGAGVGLPIRGGGRGRRPGGGNSGAAGSACATCGIQFCAPEATRWVWRSILPPPYW